MVDRLNIAIVFRVYESSFFLCTKHRFSCIRNIVFTCVRIVVGTKRRAPFKHQQSGGSDEREDGTEMPEESPTNPSTSEAQIPVYSQPAYHTVAQNSSITSQEA